MLFWFYESCLYIIHVYVNLMTVVIKECRFSIIVVTIKCYGRVNKFLSR